LACLNNNNYYYYSNNSQDDIYCATIYGTSHMREFTLDHLGKSVNARWPQLVGQAADLSPPVGSYIHQTFTHRHL